MTSSRYMYVHSTQCSNNTRECSITHYVSSIYCSDQMHISYIFWHTPSTAVSDKNTSRGFAILDVFALDTFGLET